MASTTTTGALRSARQLARPSRSALALAAAALTLGVGLPLAAGAGAATAAPADTIDAVQARLSALQNQAEAATEAYNAGKLQLAGAQRAAAAADADVARQQAALNAETGMARQLAAAQYRDGGVGKLLTFVGSGDPSAFLEQASTLSSISASQAQQIAGLKAAAKRLSDSQTLDTAKKNAAAASAQKLQTAQAHIQSLVQQQQTILAGLKEKQREELAARAAAAAAAAKAAAAAELARAQAIADAAAAAAASQAPVNSTATVSTAPVVRSSDRASVALSAAYAEIGKPYVYGGAGPNSFDCSGLTMWAFAKAGIALPHSAAAQYGYGTHVPVSQLQPGDLVFFNEGGGIGHVGIYAGNGTMVDAPHTGSTVGVHALYPGLIGGTRL